MHIPPPAAPPPTSSKDSWEGEGCDYTYPFIGWLSSPPASAETEKESAGLLHSQLKSLMCFHCDVSLLRSPPPPSENYPYIVSTPRGVLLVFEVALLFRGVRKSLKSNLSSSIHSHLPTCSFSQLFSTISSSHLLESCYSILIFCSFHHLLTHPFHLTILTLPTFCASYIALSLFRCIAHLSHPVS